MSDRIEVTTTKAGCEWIAHYLVVVVMVGTKHHLEFGRRSGCSGLVGSSAVCGEGWRKPDWSLDLLEKTFYMLLLQFGGIGRNGDKK